ncbi:polysaccharide deacetylase family protein [bacterium]|nr:MAG: polysaccharide deacetylase family protein [bacterium]
MFKRKSIIVVSCAVIIIAVFSAYVRSLYIVPVIMYHSVSADAEPDNRMQVSVDLFTRQMKFLKNHHYNVLSLEAVGQMIRDKKRFPPKSVAITFDDGYKDNYVYAYPVLMKLGLPATIFIIYNEVARSLGDRLSWDEIKEMQASGLITIGSHTLDHPNLVEIKSEAELKRQIFDSKKNLEEKLGVPVNAFCYPSGRFNAQVRDLVIQARYRFAVATGLGKNFSNQDIYLIKRVRVSNSDNLFDFWAKISGYYNSFREHNHK